MEAPISGMQAVAALLVNFASAQDKESEVRMEKERATRDGLGICMASEMLRYLPVTNTNHGVQVPKYVGTRPSQP